MKKILVGLSGGVDSAVSAYLLKKAGYEVVGGFMINYLAPPGEYCPTLEDIEVAKEVAAFLDIPFFTFNYIKEYEEKVLNYMYEGYKKGITPNPDIMCNTEIKFKVFLDEALEHGFDGIATGHYAQIEKIGNNFLLKKGIDENKDQSYFLSGLTQKQLSKSIFPIGNLKKEDVRKIAIEIGLPNALRKDSQGICFVGKVDLSKFLEKKIAHKPGYIIDTSGKVLGKHNGVFYYTIGQRKGLDLGGLKEPVFVIKKDILKNELVVGTSSDEELFKDFLELSILENPKNISFPYSGYAKIRYRQQDQKCLIDKIGEKYIVKFESPQRAIANGQICAIYDENGFLILSGVIL
ncbi:tRNA 2-thiouridine(34) synthase MnmA [Candidatus Gracilibacteria bacterium]|nr:tRNA 2-thiouridine(34) synthase MnmA [Candidatus Gracilibacteria bacterium]